MSNLYVTKEGEPAPVIPDFLRGRFYELTEEIVTEEGKTNEYAGWVWFKIDGTMIFGEPGE